MSSNKKTRLFIDFNHLASRTIFTPGAPNWNREGFDFHKHLVLNTLFSNIRKFNPDEVILAVDSRKNWRKKVYPEYKANREIKRKADDLDWVAYFEYIDKFLDEMCILPFKIMRVDFAEGDDIIAILSKHLNISKNIIVTSDKDFIQLLQYEQNRMFDPLKKAFINEEDPLRLLNIKYVMGDKKDNVPDAITNTVGKREKTAMKLIDNGELETLLEEDEEANERYERNKTLLSFNHIPDAMREYIIKKYEDYKFENVSVDYESWFNKHNLRDISSNLNKFMPYLTKLDTREYTGKKIDLFKGVF